GSGANAERVEVENNFLGPKTREKLDKAVENQQAGKDLLAASKEIVWQNNVDRHSDELLSKFQKDPASMTESERQQLAAYLNVYGYELQTRYNLSPEKAQGMVDSLLRGDPAFSRIPGYPGAGDSDSYYEALGYLKMYSVQSSQAAMGTDALLALPGGVGTVARATIAAGGAYQAGTGIGQLIDGQYGEGALNVGLGSAAIFGAGAGQSVIHKAETALVKGQVTYEFGAKPNTNELRAGNTFSELGYDVTYKTTASDRGISDVRTPDLWVNNIGKVDVYTPQTKNLGNIVKAIEEKDSQTTAVLTQIDLSLQDMQSMSSRLWGKPSVKNINTLFFQDSKGQIYRFDRPITGAK
ncbi:hypothetical protein DXF93_29395, partial [Escherichia coli]